MATVLEGFTTEKQRSVVCCFLWTKGLTAKDIHTKYFLFTVEYVCRVKRFTTWSRNSLKDVRKSQMMPDYFAMLRLRQKYLSSGWKS
jgi:hypothetical protein